MKFNNFENKLSSPFSKKIALNDNLSSNSFSTKLTTPKINKKINLYKEEEKNKKTNQSIKIENNNNEEEEKFKTPKNIINKTNSNYNNSINKDNLNKSISPIIKKYSSDNLKSLKLEKINQKNFGFFLHQVSQNLNKSFSNLYQNRSFSSNNFNEKKQNIFSKRKELNNLEYNINNKLRNLYHSPSFISNIKSNKNLINDDFYDNNIIYQEKKTFDIHSPLNYSQSFSIQNSPFIFKNNNFNNETLEISQFHIDNLMNGNDLEQYFILEIKIKNVLSKLILSKPAFNESFEFMNYYFNECLFNKLISLFKDFNYKKNYIYFIKIELLCFCLCYDVSYEEEFNKVVILLKLIFELIHFNFLVMLKFILHNTIMSNDNFIWYEKIYNILKKELKINLTNQELEESNIIKIMNNNINNIGNYYKVIIENIYSSFYQVQNKVYTLNFILKENREENIKNKKEIISSFFFKAFSFSDNYSIEDINRFFNLYLFKIMDPNGSYIFSNIQQYQNENNKIKLNQNKNIPIYYLPKINPKYKYSLVLDLDETLIYVKRDISSKSKRKVMILRPYLHEFLKKMRNLYELILFSFGTSEYVDPIINIIEKKEKYFEYRLYRQHAKIDGNNFIKDLNYLGRDIKKIIIVDNMPQAFKLHKKNGICIKGFYGDVVSDRNTLKILSIILEKIRFDADESKDIRDSLKKEENDIISKITFNDDY